MTITEAEEALLDLINTSAVRQKLAADCDIFDNTKLSEDSQLLVDAPFVLMVPMKMDFVPPNKRPSDYTGISYDDTELHIGFLVGARNYRSPAERVLGGVGDVGVNELMADLVELLRGVCLATGDKTVGRIPRVFLVGWERQEDAEGLTVYSLTVRVVGLVLN